MARFYAIYSLAFIQSDRMCLHNITNFEVVIAIPIHMGSAHSCGVHNMFHCVHALKISLKITTQL